MAGLMQGIFMPQKTPKKPKMNVAAGADKQAEVNKNRQGRGLASTNLKGQRSAMDNMAATYQGGKSTLGGA